MSNYFSFHTYLMYYNKVGSTQFVLLLQRNKTYLKLKISLHFNNKNGYDIIFHRILHIQYYLLLKYEYQALMMCPAVILIV